MGYDAETVSLVLVVYFGNVLFSAAIAAGCAREYQNGPVSSLP
jgi:hypothetical protein